GGRGIDSAVGSGRRVQDAERVVTGVGHARGQIIVQYDHLVAAQGTNGRHASRADQPYQDAFIQFYQVILDGGNLDELVVPVSVRPGQGAAGQAIGKDPEVAVRIIPARAGPISIGLAIAQEGKPRDIDVDVIEKLVVH